MTPTATAREWATERADKISAAIGEAESEIKALLDERIYQNSIRGAATQIRAKLDEAQGLVQKLRKAIHDDFGSPEEGE